MDQAPEQRTDSETFKVTRVQTQNTCAPLCPDKKVALSVSMKSMKPKAFSSFSGWLKKGCRSASELSGAGGSEDPWKASAGHSQQAVTQI